MRRVLLILLIIFFNPVFVFSAPKKMLPAASATTGEQLPHIFIYTLPETDEKQEDDELQDAAESDYIESSQNNEEEPITLELENEDDNTILGATVLKGYAQYIEDMDIISLKDYNDNFILNIKSPQKVAANKGTDLKSKIKYRPNTYYQNAEYFIAPNSISTSTTIGNFTVGAQYNNEVDRFAMLETETGLFTKYEKDKFALSTSIAKSLDTTSESNYSTFSVSPQLRLNNYLAVKSSFSSNITYNKYSSQLTLSVNPFGKKDFERLNFEIGAKETFSKETETTSSQFLFSTKFKL